MQLRHIRPRSVEWYDALMEEDRRLERLEPEEAMKLRALFSLGSAAKPPHRASGAARLQPDMAVAGSS